MINDVMYNSLWPPPDVISFFFQFWIEVLHASILSNFIDLQKYSIIFYKNKCLNFRVLTLMLGKSCQIA